MFKFYLKFNLFTQGTFGSNIAGLGWNSTWRSRVREKRLELTPRWLLA